METQLSDVMHVIAGELIESVCRIICNDLFGNEMNREKEDTKILPNAYFTHILYG